jgi:uncharacterized protein (TIGR02246 family)
MGDDELLARLVAVEAQLEIRDLEGRYSRTWDTADAVGWAGLFTDDGVFAIAAAGGEPAQRFEGRQALERMCRDYTAMITGLHLLHVPEVRVETDVAHSHIHFEFRSVRRDTPDATMQASVAGYYDTTYRRTPAGWRIAVRNEKAVTRHRAVFFDL